MQSYLYVFENIINMWFKKKEGKKENLSELPELPEMPDLPLMNTQATQEKAVEKKVFQEPAKSAAKPSIRDELPALPAFSNSKTSDKLNQDLIKSSFETDKKPYTQELEPSGHFRIEDSDSIREADSRRKEDLEKFNTSRMHEKLVRLPYKEDKAEPVFVRIDKFQNALKSFNEIKKQIAAIEDYLGEVKEIKAKEEQELEEWDKEIIEIKSKLDSIDREIFDKLE